MAMMVYPRVALSVVVFIFLSVQADFACARFNGHVPQSLPRDSLVVSPRPEDYLLDEAVPKHWDWRNVDGKNYVTSDVNQHIPQYCGSCWIHGTVAAINDRIKIMRKARFPDAMISRQAVVNCALNESGVAPGCNGGEPWMVFKLMLEKWIPDETCQPYQARNFLCTDLNVCRNCDAQDSIGCYALQPHHFAGFKIKEYAQVKGRRNIMKEIYERGPITCSYAATDEFVYNYTQNVNTHQGIFVDDTVYPESSVDHDIEIVGWDETSDGVEYWIARNSWGTYWGEAGWFRIKKGTLHIEDDCWWALPVVDRLEAFLDGDYMGSYKRGLVKQDDQEKRDYAPRECHRIAPSKTFLNLY